MEVAGEAPTGARRRVKPVNLILLLRQRPVFPQRLSFKLGDLNRSIRKAISTLIKF
jgi:hypothetical protein